MQAWKGEASNASNVKLAKRVEQCTTPCTTSPHHPPHTTPLHSSSLSVAIAASMARGAMPSKESQAAQVQQVQRAKQASVACCSPAEHHLEFGFYPRARCYPVRIVRRGFCRAICSFLDKPAGLQFTARVVKTSQTVEGQRDDAVAYRFFLRPECETFDTPILRFLKNGALACAPAPLSNCGQSARHPPLCTADA